MSQNSYLREFYALKSQIVFLADLTVLRLLLLYEQKCHKTHISASSVHTITNRVLSLFDHFTDYYNCMSKNVTEFISLRVLCKGITNRVLS